MVNIDILVFEVTGIFPKVTEERNPMRMHTEIQDLLNQANHKNVPNVLMRQAWAKLVQAMSTPANTIHSFGAFIKAMPFEEKIALVNIINLSRAEYRGLTGLGANNSPMFALLKTPVPTLSRDEHKQLRNTLREYGEVAVYLIYPSISVACYAAAGLYSDWPDHIIKKDEKENPISGLAYEYYCYCNDIEKINSQKEWGDKKQTSTQSSVNYRLSTGIITTPADLEKGHTCGHGLDHKFFKKLLNILDPVHTEDYKALKARNRFLYQGTTVFGLTPVQSIYDINNIITLQGPVISPRGTDVLTKAQIAEKEAAAIARNLASDEPSYGL